jgi:hypothetical protein
MTENILADEPTDTLERQNGAEVMVLLRELAEAGRTVTLMIKRKKTRQQTRPPGSMLVISSLKPPAFPVFHHFLLPSWLATYSPSSNT